MGTVIGLAMALGVERAMNFMLVNAGRVDLVAYVVVVPSLFLVAMLAAYPPVEHPGLPQHRRRAISEGRLPIGLAQQSFVCPNQDRKSLSGAENKAVTDRTFMRFRGPKALTDNFRGQSGCVLLAHQIEVFDILPVLFHCHSTVMSPPSTVFSFSGSWQGTSLLLGNHA